MKFQVRRMKKFQQCFTVKITQVKHTNLALHSTDITDHICCLCLSDGKFIFRHIESLRHIHKCFYCKRIMLSRNTEFLLIRTALAVFLQNTLILTINLTGVHQKFCTVIGQSYTSAAAVEDGDSEFLLQLFYSIG